MEGDWKSWAALPMSLALSAFGEGKLPTIPIPLITATLHGSLRPALRSTEGVAAAKDAHEFGDVEELRDGVQAAAAAPEETPNVEATSTFLFPIDWAHETSQLPPNKPCCARATGRPRRSRRPNRILTGRRAANMFSQSDGETGVLPPSPLPSRVPHHISAYIDSPPPTPCNAVSVMQIGRRYV